MYSHCCQTLTQCLGSELLHEDGTHDAIAINEVGSGNGSDTISNIDVVSRIEQERVSDLGYPAKWGDVVFRIGLIDSKQSESSVRLCEGAFEKGHLAAARCA